MKNKYPKFSKEAQKIRKEERVYIFYWFEIIGADIFIFIILGLLLMSYDDNYDSSKGEYWSLESMNSKEKIIYICYNSWVLLNIIGLIYIGRKIYIRKKSDT